MASCAHLPEGGREIKVEVCLQRPAGPPVLPATEAGAVSGTPYLNKVWASLLLPGLSTWGGETWILPWPLDFRDHGLQ